MLKGFALAIFMLWLAPLAGETGASSVVAKETRYLTGSATDVRPKLHGAAYNLAGGGGDVADAMQWMINRVRGCDACGVKLDVVVLRSSGSDGYNNFIAQMNGVDSVETLVIKDRADSDSDGVRETIGNAEVVFFAGGDQCNYVRYFKGTEVERAVERVHARGGGIGGTSAGLSILSEAVYDACPDVSADSASALRDPYNREVSFTYDFFRWPALNGTLTDTHFVERNRMGRLLAFLARQLADRKFARILGIGVERETSLALDDKGLARVMGKGPVYFVLADHPPETCAPGVPLTYRNYKIWKVTSGNTFNLRKTPPDGFRLVTVEKGDILSDPY